MPTDHPLLIIPFSVGLIFIVVGFIMYKFPPKEINGLYGYRTSASMKNQERWDFAQVYSSKEMMKMGGLQCLVGLIAFVYQPSEKTGTLIGLGIMILVTILLFIKVEKKIKSKFSKKD
ncbi:SdpI/YhfL family protein [Winogradskyella epiphytica]|uniref:SdpI/YhfL family protein n=1 Tax=Winogradskyella epiphytica TaxID=262005 RepID=A0A2V4XI74_9FLAO|nr:SdpI family protein [Winogradskyella epiphytica]PYE81033.1 SdpI/YhfL family protein [Winogradskyella epiphytica]GGW66354.1 hypothetical protein GCM10008085_17760 [Winogradskyella epiphytica]